MRFLESTNGDLYRVANVRKIHLSGKKPLAEMDNGDYVPLTDECFAEIQAARNLVPCAQHMLGVELGEDDDGNPALYRSLIIGWQFISNGFAPITCVPEESPRAVELPDGRFLLLEHGSIFATEAELIEALK